MSAQAHPRAASGVPSCSATVIAPLLFFSPLCSDQGQDWASFLATEAHSDRRMDALCSNTGALYRHRTIADVVATLVNASVPRPKVSFRERRATGRL